MEKMFVITKEEKANFGVFSVSYSIIGGYMNKEDAERAFNNLYISIECDMKKIDNKNNIIYVNHGNWISQIQIKYKIDEIKMNSYL